MTTPAHQAVALEQLCKRIEWAGDLVALFISVDAAVALRALLAERDELAKDAARYRTLRDEGYLHFMGEVHPCDESRRSEIIDKRVDMYTDMARAALTNKD